MGLTLLDFLKARFNINEAGEELVKGFIAGKVAEVEQSLPDLEQNVLDELVVTLCEKLGVDPEEGIEIARPFVSDQVREIANEVIEVGWDWAEGLNPKDKPDPAPQLADAEGEDDFA
jgi:hypothetical protein